MIYYLAEILRQEFGSLNLLRYVSFRAMAAFVTSLAIAIVFYPRFIEFMRRRSFGQVIRDDGPASHKSKAGTPTMGGLLIMVAVIVSSLLWCNLTNPLVIITLIVGTTFAAVGFIDDLLKIVRKNSKGLSGKIRLLIEFAVVLSIMAWFLLNLGHNTGYDLKLYIPFVSVAKYWVVLPIWAYLMIAGILVVGVANATNLTDGLDGLAAGSVVASASVLLIMAYLTGATLGSFDVSKYLLIPKVVGATELSIICAATVGATIGFLWYNAFPAQIFMGDTGALGLGSIVATVALLTKNELISLVIFGLFIVEALSVIIQRYWFKLTGKRIFPMSPIHHAFEKIGWAEPKIVVRFWIVSLLLALVALASIKVR